MYCMILLCGEHNYVMAIVQVGAYGIEWVHMIGNPSKAGLPAGCVYYVQRQ